MKTKLELKNVHDTSVLFKIKTTRPSVYMVRPTNGFLPPNGVMGVEIIYYGQTSTVDQKDKFLVQCAPMQHEPPQGDITANNFNELWSQVSPAKLTHKKMRIIGEHDKRKFTTVGVSDP